MFRMAAPKAQRVNTTMNECTGREMESDAKLEIIESQELLRFDDSWTIAVQLASLVTLSTVAQLG